jgi:hypothetical protein
MVLKHILTSCIVLFFGFSSLAQVFVSEHAIVADKKGKKEYQNGKRDITLSLEKSTLNIGGKGKQARSLKIEKVDQEQRDGYVLMNFKCTNCKNGEVIQIKSFGQIQNDKDGNSYNASIGIRVMGSRSSELYYAIRKDS